MGLFEYMKRKGWIKPNLYEFENVMKMINYATMPTSLAVFNIALSQYMITQGDDGAVYFMGSAFLYIYITFVISTSSEFFATNPTETLEELEEKKGDTAFKIVLCFGIATFLNAMGLLRLLAVWAGLMT